MMEQYCSNYGIFNISKSFSFVFSFINLDWFQMGKNNDINIEKQMKNKIEPNWHKDVLTKGS